MSQTTVGRISPETCDALWEVLTKEGFMEVPKTPDQWHVVASEMERRWNFPTCLGAMDGKHVNIVAPARSGSLVFNYKKPFSIVLLAICNASYEFIMVDIGEAGRQSDAGVFANSNIGHCITNNRLAVPKPKVLRGTTHEFPYIFVADDAFPLRMNIIKPYSETRMEIEKVIANYQISHARRIIEKAFGILTARFRISSRPTNAKVEHVESYTKAPFTLLRIRMKTDKKVSVFTLRSHCSAMKTDTFENAHRKRRLLKTETFENAKPNVNTDNRYF